jgi:hypothetical protein
MAFFAYLAGRYSGASVGKMLNTINDESPYRKEQAPVRPNNDFLSKDKVEEKRQQEELEKAMGVGVTKYMPPERVAKMSQEVQETRIVGVAKPLGFWTKFVMSQKIGFMLALGGLQNESKSGYWVNVIKAQAASQSKEQNRGR